MSNNIDKEKVEVVFAKRVFEDPQEVRERLTNEQLKMLVAFLDKEKNQNSNRAEVAEIDTERLTNEQLKMLAAAFLKKEVKFTNPIWNEIDQKLLAKEEVKCPVCGKEYFRPKQLYNPKQLPIDPAASSHLQNPNPIKSACDKVCDSCREEINGKIKEKIRNLSKGYRDLKEAEKLDPQNDKIKKNLRQVRTSIRNIRTHPLVDIDDSMFTFLDE